MNLDQIKEAIIKNVYHIDASRKVALHKHDKSDELFYCISGSGYGVLADEEVPLSVGKVFIVPAGVMHALRTDRELYVCSFLIPLVSE